LSKKALLIISFLFALSVIIRLPNLNRPLSKHHEFVTAHILCILNIWEQAGIKDAHFLPKLSFGNKTDKFINIYASGIKDKSGNYYYLSHPPLSYYLPFFSFKLFNIKANALSLQTFNLLIHFIICIFIYLITQIVLFRKRNKSSIYPGIISAACYLFMPITLWFHSNVYTIDIPAQLFFTIAVYISLQVFLHKKRSLPWLGLLFISVFALSYSEWIGVFFSIIFIGLLIRYHKRIPNALFLAAIVGVANSSAIIITILQYAQINGITELANSMWERFIERTGYVNTPISYNLKQIVFNYATSFLPVLLFIQFYLIISKAKPLKNKNIRIFLVLSLFPALLHHIIFLNFAGHDFAAIKSATFIAVLSGIVFNIWLIKKRITTFKASSIGPILITLIICISQYYYINRPGEISWKGDPYIAYKNIGDRINKESTSDQVIFMEDFKANPQMVYYAGRNIKTYTNEWELRNFLKKHHLTKAIIFTIDKMGIKSVRRISLSE